jgi:anti-sigma regulatory factor (Ser/Thr protein kinase)
MPGKRVRGDSALRSRPASRVLISLEDDHLARRLIQDLPDRFEAGTLDSVPDWAAAVGEFRPALVVCPLERAELVVRSFGARAVGRPEPTVPPHPLVVFLVPDREPREFFPDIERLGVWRFVHAAILERPGAFACLIEGCLGEAASRPLARGCPCEGACSARTDVLRHTDERHDIVEGICRELAAAFGEDYQVTEHRLILDEILNNALFHAFRDGDGSPLYGPGVSRALRSGDRIEIERAIGPDCFVFRVSDNAGRLEPEVVLREIGRQFSGQGWLQSRGRGLFLAFSFSHAFILDRIPGRRTRLTIEVFRGAPDRHKMFLLGEADAWTEPEARNPRRRRDPDTDRQKDSVP